MRRRIRRGLLRPRAVFLMRLGLLDLLRARRRRYLVVAVPTAVLRTIHLNDARTACSRDGHLHMAYLGRLHLLHGRHIGGVPRGYQDLWLRSWRLLLGVCLGHRRIVLARRAGDGHLRVALLGLWLRIALMHLRLRGRILRGISGVLVSVCLLLLLLLPLLLLR
jgi:hypothetical protein